MTSNLLKLLLVVGAAATVAHANGMPPATGTNAGPQMTATSGEYKVGYTIEAESQTRNQFGGFNYVIRSKFTPWAQMSAEEMLFFMREFSKHVDSDLLKFNNANHRFTFENYLGGMSFTFSHLQVYVRMFADRGAAFANMLLGKIKGIETGGYKVGYTIEAESQTFNQFGGFNYVIRSKFTPWAQMSAEEMLFFMKEFSKHVDSDLLKFNNANHRFTFENYLGGMSFTFSQLQVYVRMYADRGADYANLILEKIRGSKPQPQPTVPQTGTIRIGGGSHQITLTITISGQLMTINGLDGLAALTPEQRVATLTALKTMVVQRQGIFVQITSTTRLVFVGMFTTTVHQVAQKIDQQITYERTMIEQPGTSNTPKYQAFTIRSPGFKYNAYYQMFGNEVRFQPQFNIDGISSQFKRTHLISALLGHLRAGAAPFTHGNTITITGFGNKITVSALMQLVETKLNALIASNPKLLAPNGAQVIHSFGQGGQVKLHKSQIVGANGQPQTQYTLYGVVANGQSAADNVRMLRWLHDQYLVPKSGAISGVSEHTLFRMGHVDYTYATLTITLLDMIDEYEGRNIGHLRKKITDYPAHGSLQQRQAYLTSILTQIQSSTGWFAGNTVRTRYLIDGLMECFMTARQMSFYLKHQRDSVLPNQQA